MATYEVVEIVTSGLSQSDCRCIDRVRYVDEDGEEGERRASQAYFDIKGGDTYYVEVDGERHTLEPATKFNSRYVRAAPTDTDEDPLLAVPSVSRQAANRS